MTSKAVYVGAAVYGVMCLLGPFSKAEQPHPHEVPVVAVGTTDAPGGYATLSTPRTDGGWIRSDHEIMKPAEQHGKFSLGDVVEPSYDSQI